MEVDFFTLREDVYPLCISVTFDLCVCMSVSELGEEQECFCQSIDDVEQRRAFKPYS